MSYSVLYSMLSMFPLEQVTVTPVELEGNVKPLAVALLAEELCADNGEFVTSEDSPSNVLVVPK